MSWFLPNGEGIFSPAMGKLVAECVTQVFDEMALDADFEFHVPVFDDLIQEQQTVIFHQVAFGLLNKETPAIDLTAPLESGVDALFAVCRENIALELDDEEDRHEWRDLVRDTYKAEFDEILPRNMKFSRWDEKIDGLQALITGDNYDFLLKIPEHVRPDGFDMPYFDYIPPDPREEVAEKLKGDILLLCDTGGK